MPAWVTYDNMFPVSISINHFVGSDRRDFFPSHKLIIISIIISFISWSRWLSYAWTKSNGCESIMRTARLSTSQDLSASFAAMLVFGFIFIKVSNQLSSEELFAVVKKTKFVQLICSRAWFSICHSFTMCFHFPPFFSFQSKYASVLHSVFIESRDCVRAHWRQVRNQACMKCLQSLV